jgi:polysaccharide export outer membrane protein
MKRGGWIRLAVLLAVGACSLGEVLIAQDLGGGSAAAAAAQSAQIGSSSSPGFFFEELGRVPEGRALLAATTPDYPVTPGDVYTLTFLKSSDVATLSLTVGNDYSVNLGVFGKVVARDQSFASFKAGVEKTVAAAYPGSAPEVFIRSTGTFAVKVEGEVKESTLVQSWGLERLSTIVQRIKTSAASERSVLVSSANGGEKTYDLFLALRKGELVHNPYVKPSDTIVLGRFARRVTVMGSVYRPGTYELLAPEGLRELVEFYGEGLTNTARAEYSSIVRKANRDNPEGEVLFFVAAFLPGAKLPPSYDGDVVTVPAREKYIPVVYFEGAITAGSETAKQYAMSRVPFKPGDKLSRSLDLVANRLAAGADLQRAFIARKGSDDTIPVDLERLLYAYDPLQDILLQAEDRIIIPFGSLDVFVTGEVATSAWISTAALTRLSAAITPLLTKYASIRDISVKSADGIEKHYDLFRAERYGDLSQDPILLPGDVVTASRFVRVATVAGEVRRPGTYQLLEGEGLAELIEVYANGFTDQANPTRISLVRSPFTGHSLGEMRYIDYSEARAFVPESYDMYSVPSLSSLFPVAYFEGAIRATETAQVLDTSNRVPYQFVPGQMLSQAAQALRKGFTAESDLAKAYVIRENSRIPVNIADLIYRMDFSKDLALQANDVVIVPFRQFFVSVSGAVNNPGRFPYIPDRAWDYYIGLAGGINEELNTGKIVKIIDLAGREKTKKDLIEPEDSIVVPANSFLYGFGKVSSILTTIISVASLVLTLIKLYP